MPQGCFYKEVEGDTNTKATLTQASLTLLHHIDFVISTSIN